MKQISSELLMFIFFFCSFFYSRSETNTFQRLFANGSNSYLIDRSRPTTVFAHGFSDSFHPRRNSECLTDIVKLNNYLKSIEYFLSSIFYWKFNFGKKKSKRKKIDFISSLEQSTGPHGIANSQSKRYRIGLGQIVTMSISSSNGIFRTRSWLSIAPIAKRCT